MVTGLSSLSRAWTRTLLFPLIVTLLPSPQGRTDPDRRPERAPSCGDTGEKNSPKNFGKSVRLARADRSYP